jgi:hypothetical protein
MVVAEAEVGRARNTCIRGWYNFRTVMAMATG